jgi:hypothetical protein
MNTDLQGQIEQNPSTNPFSVESPEKLSPQLIVNLFVSAYTKLEVIKQRKHTFIWGSRGSGKSMLLRFLEPQCQILASPDPTSLFDQPDAFLAIYAPCKEGFFNKTEIRKLDPLTVRILSEHMLNLHIAARTIDCLKTQLAGHLRSDGSLATFADEVLSLFDGPSISDSVVLASRRHAAKDEPLEWLEQLFASELRKVSWFLRRTALRQSTTGYDGATSGYHDFLLPFIQITKSAFSLSSIPVYVLLDDADRLLREQQVVVNTWIANRDQQHVCFKVASEFDGYKTFRNSLSSVEDSNTERTINRVEQGIRIEGGGWIESPHDYSEINVDELYTNSKTNYIEKVKLIANRRMSLNSSAITDIEAYLPSDPSQTEEFNKIKKETAKEWELKGQPGDQDDYVYRYASARLFQHLRDTKRRKSYAGFNNIVHLSSGVIRSFLEPCYLMFDECRSKQEDPTALTFIPPDVQDKILYKYSEDFLVVDIEKIRNDLPPEEWSRLEALNTLLNSLGKLFYERLHDPEAREARLFSFTVRGTVSQDVAEVLRLGVKYRYFQLRTYSTKEGGGRERWYILNRRLCPIFKLDPTGFEGRISLTADLLQLACSDSGKFVRLRLRQSIGLDQPDLFSLVEEED